MHHDCTQSTTDLILEPLRVYRDARGAQGLLDVPCRFGVLVSRRQKLLRTTRCHSVLPRYSCALYVFVLSPSSRLVWTWNDFLALLPSPRYHTATASYLRSRQVPSPTVGEMRLSRPASSVCSRTRRTR